MKTLTSTAPTASSVHAQLTEVIRMCKPENLYKVSDAGLRDLGRDLCEVHGKLGNTIDFRSFGDTIERGRVEYSITQLRKGLKTYAQAGQGFLQTVQDITELSKAIESAKQHLDSEFSAHEGRQRASLAQSEFTLSGNERSYARSSPAEILALNEGASTSDLASILTGDIEATPAELAQTVRLTSERLLMGTLLCSPGEQRILIECLEDLRKKIDLPRIVKQALEEADAIAA